jgi:hypothetical protein
MSKRRLDQRRMAEAAERLEKEQVTPTKRATRKAATKAPRAKTARRTKDKAAQRKRLVWCVYNGSMKEEARFPYDQRAAAEEKLEQLKAKGTKKLYFLQPVKELISDSAPPTTASLAAVDEIDEIDETEALEAGAELDEEPDSDEEMELDEDLDMEDAEESESETDEDESDESEDSED